MEKLQRFAILKEKSKLQISNSTAYDRIGVMTL